jgi:hypothetical protein
MVSLKHWERERVKTEKSEQGVLGRHGNVKEKMSVSAIVQQRGLNLEQVGVILNQQFASGLQGSLFQLFKQLGHLGRVEVVDGEPLVHCRLDGVSYPTKLISELIFDTAEPGVQKSWIGQNQREEEAADFVEAVLNANEVLRPQRAFE